MRESDSVQEDRSVLHCVAPPVPRPRRKGVEMTHEHYCATAFNLPDYMPELLHDKKEHRPAVPASRRIPSPVPSTTSA